MRSRLSPGVALLFTLSLAGSASAGTQRFYYDPLGRVLGETQTVGEVRTSRSDAADNISYLHVLSLYGPVSTATLNGNQGMVADQSLTSSDGRFGLSVQDDGNLVVYQNSNGTALWASNTGGHLPGYLAMQGDGNLVFYGPDDSVIWSTGTSGNAGADLVMQTDGNLVIYKGSTPIWASGTGGH